MSDRPIHAVTGAFGFSGKYIARRLLDQGCQVRTLTGSPDRRDPFGGAVRAYPLCFDDPDRLSESLAGVSVLYNTYWVRFDHKTFTHAGAVENTITLFRAAKKAGVERLVHVSITNPAEDSPLPYFHGKARLERELRASGLSYAILRPAVLFGKEDVLINNIAWMLRRFPVFGVFGKGDYRLQPIYVDDFACLAVEKGEDREDVTIDAIGPETFTFRELVRQVGAAIGRRRPMISIPPRFAYFVGRVMGSVLGDIVITREEIEGLMGDLLYVDSPPVGTTGLTDWAAENADTLGRCYASELKRRRDRTCDYVA